MKNSRSFFSPSVLVISANVLLGCATPLIAQVDLTSLTGTVTAPSGSLQGHAHVTAVENSTHLRRQGVSDAVGRYGIAELPVGTYTITIDHPGFETLTFSDVQQVVGRTRTLDARVKVSGGEERKEN